MKSVKIRLFIALNLFGAASYAMSIQDMFSNAWSGIKEGTRDAAAQIVEETKINTLRTQVENVEKQTKPTARAKACLEIASTYSILKSIADKIPAELKERACSVCQETWNNPYYISLLQRPLQTTRDALCIK